MIKPSELICVEVIDKHGNVSEYKPVEELIRCKDCRYYRTIHCRMDIHHKEITIYRAIPNGYCNFGKRKEE